HSSQRDHFLGCGVATGRVEEAARQPERALLHRAANKGAHGVELAGSRRALLRCAHDLCPYAAVSNEERDVWTKSARLEATALRGQIDPNATVGIHDNRRYTLREDRTRLAELRTRKALGGVRVHVDESWRDQQALRLDDC